MCLLVLALGSKLTSSQFPPQYMEVLSNHSILSNILFKWWVWTLNRFCESQIGLTCFSASVAIGLTTKLILELKKHHNSLDLVRFLLCVSKCSHVSRVPLQHYIIYHGVWWNPVPTCFNDRILDENAGKTSFNWDVCRCLFRSDMLVRSFSDSANLMHRLCWGKHISILLLLFLHFYIMNMQCAEPILPIRRIRKLRRAPKHQGTLLPKMF